MKTDDADNSTSMYLDRINMLLDTFAPLKRVNKYKMKFKSKPWITLKKQLLKNFISKKDPILKEKFYTNYKKYSPPLWRKVNRLIMINILIEIGRILKTHGKELNPLFL